MWRVAGPVAFSDAFVVIDVAYRPRNPEENPLYGVVAGHLETFLAGQRDRDRSVPGFVEREFREFLGCVMCLSSDADLLSDSLKF